MISAFDAADRITTSGTVYDALGRTTTVPDGDALDSGALTVAYHVNDLVRSIGIAGGATQTYTLDVDAQRVRSWTDGTTTRTHHYDGASDNPSWTAEGGTAWTRNIGGLTGDLGAIYDSTAGTATLQLTNLHGDVVATAPTSSMTLASTSEATEYGVPRGATGTRYGWLGGKQRAADTPGGLSIMGVRLYNPTAGRFLQVDPVYGGNANAYTYPNNPLTQYDLDGRRSTDDDAQGVSANYKYRPYKKKKCGWGCRIGNAGRWVNKNRWRLAGYALSGVCIVASAGACVGAALGYYALKTVSTARQYGFGRNSWRHHLANAVSTMGFAAPGVAGGAAGRVPWMTRWGRYAINAHGELPSIVCSTYRRCASPGAPR